MSKAEKIEKIFEAIEEVEDDIKVLQSNIAKAREYLTNTKAEDIDTKYFAENFDIEEGLKHIELF